MWERTKAAETLADRAREQAESTSALSTKSTYRRGRRTGQTRNASRTNETATVSGQLHVRDLANATSTTRPGQASSQGYMYPATSITYPTDQEQLTRYHQQLNSQDMQLDPSRGASPATQQVYTTYQQGRPHQGASSQRLAPSPGNQVRNLPSVLAPDSAREQHHSDNTLVQASSSSRPLSTQLSAKATTGSANPSSMPGKINYDPPVVSDFDALVSAQALPLPTCGAEISCPQELSSSQKYSWRAHELRTSIRRMTAGEPHRVILLEEIVWWNRLGKTVQLFLQTAHHSHGITKESQSGHSQASLSDRRGGSSRSLPSLAAAEHNERYHQSSLHPKLDSASTCRRQFHAVFSPTRTSRSRTIHDSC